MDEKQKVLKDVDKSLEDIKLSDSSINKALKKIPSTKVPETMSFRVTFGRTESANVKKTEINNVKIPPAHAYSIMNIPHKKKVDVSQKSMVYDILKGDDTTLLDKFPKKYAIPKTIEAKIETSSNENNLSNNNNSETGQNDY